MNSHMSEILSWALESLADALLPKSSEVISNEGLKSKIDSLNQKNGNWIPEEKLQRDVRSMMDAAMEMPGWCQCDECTDELNEVVSGENQMGEPSSTQNANGGEELCSVPELEIVKSDSSTECEKHEGLLPEEDNGERGQECEYQTHGNSVSRARFHSV